MSLTRREFIASLGGSGLFYAFRITPTSPPAQVSNNNSEFEPLPGDPTAQGDMLCQPSYQGVDHRDWILFGADGTVNVYTGRMELGQGLKTVITAFVTQGLDISLEKLTVVMGDTDCCPDDGITSGSSSTQEVGWAFWLACLKIRGDIVSRAADALDIPAAELEYRKGGIGRKESKENLVTSFELGQGETVFLDVEPVNAIALKEYTDLKISNVNAEKIVTGSLLYVGDLQEPGMLYAGWLRQPYHRRLTKLVDADMKAARAMPGVKIVDVFRGRPAVIAERYTEVEKALEQIKANWEVPGRSKTLLLEEARANAKLLEVKEQKGDMASALAAGEIVLSETYTTQYITHAQLETDMAVARWSGNKDRLTVWASSQHPHMARQQSADYVGLPLEKVRVVGMPAGGAFGGKQANPVNREAALLAEAAGAPVKLIYSRKDQFALRGNYKAACSIDVTTAVNSNGKISARKLDIYQDIGDGAAHTYDIPNVLVKTYRDPGWPVGMASTRGTSYVQTCFATESHIDMLAHRIGMDPLEFRCLNVAHPAYVNLLEACAEKIGYGKNQLEIDEGIGFAIIVHAINQLGAIAVKVAVDRLSGKVTVKQVTAAFDIGTVVNLNTVTVCLRGAIAWGIGHALREKIELDGHCTQTGYFSQYGIARFSDMPPIDMVFLNNFNPLGGPRGCGEMPVIPTIGAIANAIYNATGVRFYSIPITPGKIKEHFL